MRFLAWRRMGILSAIMLTFVLVPFYPDLMESDRDDELFLHLRSQKLIFYSILACDVINFDQILLF